MNYILELYSRSGESLTDIGIDESVLPINTVDKVLELYKSSKILVLGGDIYIKKTDGRFELFYADWFYEGNNIEESITKAKNYLRQFKKKDLYVSFVLK